MSVGDPPLWASGKWSMQILAKPTTTPTVIKTEQELLEIYGGQPGMYLSMQDDAYNSALQVLSQKWNYETDWAYKVPDIHVGNNDANIIVATDQGDEIISRAELVKYLGERRLVQENEFVRKVYDRYQVAVKLARSDDDGNTGV